MDIIGDIGLDSYLTTPDGDLVKLDPEKEYTFGRDQTADITVPDTLCSRAHCRLRWDPSGTWVLKDLESRNGTYVDNSQVSQVVELNDRSTIQIGGQRFTLHLLPPGADPSDLAGQDVQVGAMETFEMNSSALLHGEKEPLNGQLDGLEDILRFFLLTKKSGRFIIDDDDSQLIWFGEGRPVHATCGEQVGMAALREFVESKGKFSFYEGETFAGEPSIVDKIQDVLVTLFPSDEEERRHQAYDIERATELQRHLLERMPKVPGYDIGVSLRGLSGVSGDFYDVSVLPDGDVQIVLGDVSGHGVQAAMVATNALKTLRLLRDQYQDLAELMRALNAEVKEDLLQSQFITMFAARLHPSTGEMTIANAGHHPALMLDRDGDQPVEEVKSKGMALGIAGDEQYKKMLNFTKITLPIGSAIIQFTDGLFESNDEQGEEYGWDRLCATVGTQRTCADMKNLTSALNNTVSEFAASLDDDMTVLAIARVSEVDTRTVVSQRPAEREAIGGRRPARHEVSVDEAANGVIRSGPSTEVIVKEVDSEAGVNAGSVSFGQVLGVAKVVEQLTRGETGITYRGEHRSLGMEVAVKVLDVPKKDADAWRKKFLEDARSAVKVHHPNVVQVLDAGVSDEGFHYQIFEMMPGGSLQDRIDKGQRLTGDQIELFIKQIGDGLRVIHGAGMTHRDIKPSNILYDEQDEPHIADLGQASVTNDTGLNQFANKQTLVGSPAYMAPEVVDPSQQEAAPADIYSLGVTLYQLVSGTLPCTGDNILEILQAHMEGRVVPIRKQVPGIDQRLAELIGACMQRDPRKRPNAEAVATWFQTHAPPPAKPATPAPAPTKPAASAQAPAKPGAAVPSSASSNRLWIIGGVVVSLLLIIAIITILLM